jgi:hypothetical protein
MAKKTKLYGQSGRLPGRLSKGHIVLIPENDEERHAEDIVDNVRKAVKAAINNFREYLI